MDDGGQQQPGAVLRPVSVLKTLLHAARTAGDSEEIDRLLDELSLSADMAGTPLEGGKRGRS